MSLHQNPSTQPRMLRLIGAEQASPQIIRTGPLKYVTKEVSDIEMPLGPPVNMFHAARHNGIKLCDAAQEASRLMRAFGLRDAYTAIENNFREHKFHYANERPWRIQLENEMHNTALNAVAVHSAKIKPEEVSAMLAGVENYAEKTEIATNAILAACKEYLSPRMAIPGVDYPGKAEKSAALDARYNTLLKDLQSVANNTEHLRAALAEKREHYCHNTETSAAKAPVVAR